MTNHKKSPSDILFAFLGNAPLLESVLEELAKAALAPQKIIQKSADIPELVDELSREPWDVFVVASFGALLPKELINMPRHGTINVHPSLLPRLRGPSPIRSAILYDEKATGVSIMFLDDKMDHGPLLAQKRVLVEPWPPRGKVLDELLAREGGRLLAQVLPLWVAGEIEAREQNHDLATYTKVFEKEDGLLDISASAYTNLLKIRAYEGWPGTYAFFTRAGKRIRVQILDAHLASGELVIDLVKPEGKKEMSYAAFLRGGAKPAHN